MARRRYALERGGPKDLLLRWRWGMRGFVVALGDRSWKLERSAVKAGTKLVLPGGSSLLVRAVKPAWWTIGRRNELLVERDGVPVPGSDGDPRTIGRRAARLVLLFALLRLFLVLLWMSFSRRDGAPPGGVLTAFLPVETLALIVLGILAAFGRRLPVALAAGVFALETLVVIASGAVPNPIGFLVQVLVIVHLLGAWRRMKPRTREPSLASVFE